MSNRYQLRTFGSLRIEHEDQVIGRFLHHRIPDRLVALVAAHDGLLSVERAIELVWPDEPARDPRLLLNENLYQLRKRLSGWGVDAELAKSLLRNTNAELVLDTGLRTDLDAWRRVVRAPIDATTAPTAAQIKWAEHRMAEGFLTGFDEPWAHEARARMAAQLRQVTDAVAGARMRTVVSTNALPGVASLVARVGAHTDPRIGDDLPVDDLPRAAVERSARYLCQVARSLEPEMVGPHRDTALTLLDGYGPRLERAHMWAVDDGKRSLAVSFCASLWQWWLDRRQSGAAQIVVRSLSLPGRGAEHDEALALHGLGCLNMASGDLKIAERNLSTALEAWKRLKDDGRLARTVGAMAMVRYRSGDYDQALRLNEQALAVHRAVGAEGPLAYALNDHALIECALSRTTAARLSLHESISLSESLGLVRAAATAHELAATLAIQDEDTLSAGAHYEEAIAGNAILGDARHLASTLLGRGAIAHWQHEHGRRGNEALGEAEALYRRAEEVSRDSSDLIGVGEALRFRASLALDRGDREGARRLAQTSLAILESGRHAHAVDALRRILDQV